MAGIKARCCYKQCLETTNTKVCYDDDDTEVVKVY